ncbi:MAG: MATE family efflux transporter [Treponema sp.]|jgi:putative MATE family efflux protein|nr:MATE family efflux transporter [Treponema sp.]
MSDSSSSTPGNLMGTRPVGRLLLSMSAPMMFSMMVQALYNIVDSIFVAQIGENALTAVTMAAPVQFLMIGIGIGTGVGINSLLSRSLGERNFEMVNKSAVNGLFLVWVSSAVFMILGWFLTDFYFRTQSDIEEILQYGKDYLLVVTLCSFVIFNQVTFERLLISTGKTFYSMISQGAGALTNIILDPIMIFGLFGFPRMGVKGAAIATVAGQLVGTSIALYYNFTKNHEIKISFRNFRPEWKIIRSIYSVGIPSILMQCIGSAMNYAINRILITFTPTAIAVFGVFFRVQSFIFMPVFGLNNAVVPIVAFNYGARNRKRIIKTIKLSLLYAGCIMFTGFILFQFFPGLLLRMFNATEEMMSIGIAAFKIVSLIYIFAGFCIVVGSVFQALGNGIESLFVAIGRQLVVLLPAAWFLSLTGNVNAIWWSFPIAECISLVLSIFFFWQTYMKKIKPLP